jgi:hypothetical protein
MYRSLFSIVLCVTGCSASHGTFVHDDAEAPEPAEAAPPPKSDAAPELADATPLPEDAAFGDGGKPFAQNLIPNGDFELGNTLFGSDYAYATINQIEGQYTVGTDPQAWNGALIMKGDHTTGWGNMFIGNGKSTPDRVWFTTQIAVQQNTQYYFEAFVMNLFGYDENTPVGPSKLSFYANGELLGTRTSAKVGVWEGLSTTWTSGNATTVDLQLINAETQAIGNDFAVDDIYLGTVSIVN